jgi:hypothetical protein
VRSVHLQPPASSLKPIALRDAAEGRKIRKPRIFQAEIAPLQGWQSASHIKPTARWLAGATRPRRVGGTGRPIASTDRIDTIGATCTEAGRICARSPREDSPDSQGKVGFGVFFRQIASWPTDENREPREKQRKIR